MSVSPRELLGEARELAKRVEQETGRRSATSKAYYAAFHGAKKFHERLPLPGQSRKGVGEHENLIHQLRYPDSKLEPALQSLSISIGTLLLKLRPSRILADYSLETELSLREMHDAIEMAAQLLNLADPK